MVLRLSCFAGVVLRAELFHVFVSQCYCDMSLSIVCASNDYLLNYSVVFDEVYRTVPSTCDAVL